MTIAKTVQIHHSIEEPDWFNLAKTMPSEYLKICPFVVAMKGLISISNISFP